MVRKQKEDKTYKNAITYVGYILYSLGIVGLLWIYIFIPFGNRIRLLFRGWLRIIYYLFLVFFYIGSLAVYIGAGYYFTVWYVMNPESQDTWTPGKIINTDYNINKL